MALMEICHNEVKNWAQIFFIYYLLEDMKSEDLPLNFHIVSPNL